MEYGQCTNSEMVKLLPAMPRIVLAIFGFERSGVGWTLGEGSGPRGADLIDTSDQEYLHSHEGLEFPPGYFLILFNFQPISLRPRNGLEVALSPLRAGQ